MPSSFLTCTRASSRDLFWIVPPFKKTAFAESLNPLKKRRNKYYIFLTLCIPNANSSLQITILYDMIHFISIISLLYVGNSVYTYKGKLLCIMSISIIISHPPLNLVPCPNPAGQILPLLNLT